MISGYQNHRETMHNKLSGGALGNIFGIPVYLGNKNALCSWRKMPSRTVTVNIAVKSINNKITIEAGFY